MKALIQKDFKENLKVALIGLLIFSVILLHAYEVCVSALTTLLGGQGTGQAGVLQPLQSTNLLTTAAFYCAIFGAILGWLQTRNEAHPDLWAFLIHRPVTRAEIFLAKSIAGLCLYAIGSVLPLAILVVVARTPGHVAAPFEWAMVLPLVSLLLVGIAFYFAGLLTGRRHARWYLSRSFGLGLAIIAAGAALGVAAFWQSLIWIAVAVAFSATAAWGAYQSGGFYRGQPVTGKLALTVAITAGCGLAMFAAVGLLVTLLLNPLHNSRPFTYSLYQITRDGTIYKETLRNNEIVEVVDLEGHLLLDPVTHRTIDTREFQNRLAWGPTVFTGPQYHQDNRNPLATRFFQLVNVTDKTLWYLDRHGKLIGYDGQTRKSIGSLDPHRADGTQDHDPFLFSASGYYFYNLYADTPLKLLPTAKTVYAVDFRERSVKPVFNVPDDERIDGFSEAGYSAYQGSFLFTTHRTVRLINYEGKTIFTLPYEPAYSEYPQVQLSILHPAKALTNNFAVWFYPNSETNRAADWKMPIHVVWPGPDQVVTKRVELPYLQLLPETESWPDQAFATLLPPGIHLLVDHKITSVWNLCCFALALISAFIGLGLVKRYNLSAKACMGWTLFIFLFGITGLLGLLCTEEWPVREMCPECKKLRTVDRATCEHCGSTFSAPEKNGSEIFAPLLKA